MKLLLTNDDGIAAPGLEALFAAAAQLGDPVVVAPVDTHSGCSHRVTTDGPIRIEQRRSAWYAVGGTPADCTRVGLQHLVPDAAWVLSGINAGGNLGADVHYSGTVAAAREAVLHGWPAVALSQYRKRGLAVDWQRATAWTVPLLRELLARPWTPGTFWNINLPHLGPDEPDPEVVFCRLDPTPLPLSYRHEAGGLLHYNGDYHSRRREPGCDVDVCFSGKIAVTEIALF
ncbi:MAG TPA: 5'/3'-nucleotidase SurE [Gemmataceae bacterium]|nr:5'/3'-nucleotidase SurE [Gemmataceae bacterium]